MKNFIKEDQQELKEALNIVLIHLDERVNGEAFLKKLYSRRKQERELLEGINDEEGSL